MSATEPRRFEDRLLAELRRVVAERPAPAERAASAEDGARRRAIGVRLPRLLLIGVVSLAVSATALAATGIWSPEIGTDTSFPPPSVSETPVPRAMTEALGVLRRPATPRDHSSDVEATLRRATLMNGVRPQSVRYLAPGVPGEATVLLSAVHGIPLFTEKEAACVLRPYPFRGLGNHEPVSGCFDLGQLLAGEAREMVSADGVSYALAIGLVPDGVATVTAEFRDAPARTVPVANNYFELALRGPELSNAHGEAGIQRTVWRDSDGTVVPQRRGSGR